MARSSQASTARAGTRAPFSTLALQAVVNGVAARSTRFVVLAQRTSGGSIRIRWFARETSARKWRVLRWPLIRGAVAALDRVVFGLEALLESADGMGAFLAAASGAGVAGGCLFFAVPPLLNLAWPRDEWLASGVVSWDLVELAVRVGILAVWVAVLPRLGGFRRYLRLQAAANQALTAFESDRELTVEAARSQRKAHPLCGASLVLAVPPLAVLLDGAADWLVDDPVLSIVARVAAFPVGVGLIYEVLRAGGLRFFQTWILGAPEDRQLELALAALRHALRLEKGVPGAPGAEEFEVRTLSELGGIRVPAADFRML